jgi:curved DNA-binding protein CbpA
VDRDATPAELRRAYRRMALDAHPDRRADGAPADVMAALNEAWNVLGDPVRRAEYDRMLAAASRPAPPTAPARPRHASRPAEAEPEPAWVDLTHGLRTFRWMLTTALVLGGALVLLVFFLIVFPGKR